jgi:hypothetical protein
MMNDFTKEELGILACNLCINPKTKDILSKLASMINNYCEHEWDNFYKGSINIGIYCNKCNKKLNGS